MAANVANLEAAARRVRWELHFMRDITAVEPETPRRQFRFHPTRAWRFDFAWPLWLVAVEVEGLTPIRFVEDDDGSTRAHVGRHQSVDGMNDDLEKYAEATLLGWRVLRVSQAHVKSGQACMWTERLLAFARSNTVPAPSQPPS